MHTPTVYLRANEQMQISPLCLVLMDEKLEEGTVGLLIRLPILTKKSAAILTPAVMHLPIHFAPHNRSIKKEMHIIPELILPPRETTALIHFIYKNPLVLRALEEKLWNLSNRNELDATVMDMFQSLKSNLSYETIAHFSVSTQSKDLYLLEQHGNVISEIGAFKASNRGGYFTFTTTVATTYDQVAQTITVNCKMYIFVDHDKLGYYFEFFLNHQSLLHQKIYDELPDLLMEHHPFLEQALTVLESSTNEQPAVVELIEKFREAL
jgi:hypothetical protein